MNRTLEKMAAAIFKSWFIDFDPVHAKADGRDTGLPAEVADLFPDSFEDSDLGPIPKGWHVAAVDAVAEIVKGRSYKSAELQPSDAALVTLKSFLRGGGYREDGLKPYTGKYTTEQVVQPGEIIVAMTDVTQNAEVIGRPAIVMPDTRYGMLVASLDTSVVRPTSVTVSTPFLYGLFSTEAFRAHTYAHSSGTTVLHLAKNAIPSFTFPCPTEQVQKAFVSFVGPLKARQQMMHGQNCRLAGLRDTLLPKLMSGEIEVPDVTQATGRAE
jgi:type I restriction enzyme S subunit